MAAGDGDWSASNWLGDLQVSTNDLNQFVMDYLVTEGYKEAAQKFREESGVEFPNDAYSTTLDARIQIRQAVQEGQLSDAITMINDLHPELLENNKSLHFHLLQQQLIELIRQQHVEEALRFAQEKLAEKGEENPKLLHELERTLALLAFENPEQSPFGDLLNCSHRHEVANEANAAILEADHSASLSKLEYLLRVVVWAQDQLDKRHIQYPKMVDIADAVIQAKSRTSN